MKISHPERILKATWALLGWVLIALVVSKVLPLGINRSFVIRSWQLAIPILLPLVLVSLYLTWFRKIRFPKASPRDAFRGSDFWVVLIPLTPVAQYLVANRDLLSAAEIPLIFGAFSVGAVGFVLLFRVAFGVAGMPRFGLCLGLALTYLLFNMASLGSQLGWHRTGSLPVQLGVFGAAFAVCYGIDSAKRIYLSWLAVGMFVLNSGSAYFSALASEETPQVQEPQSELVSMPQGKRMRERPNIYLLTYDSYVENETMLQYGMDNSAQEQYLTKLGFHLYRGTYSVGASTQESMSRVLDVSTYPTDHGNLAVSGAGAVQSILKSNGYKTFGILSSDYFFRRVGSSYEVSYPRATGSWAPILVKAILEGEFRFDVEFEQVNQDEFLKRKRQVLAQTEEQPKFIHSHTGPGHSQNSGACLPNETDLFKNRLSRANQEMRVDVETIMKNDPGALIIINGDHGPYLTKNCYSLEKYDSNAVTRLDLQDRYGSFLAIHWPAGTRAQHDEIRILQDLFPVVFTTLYEDDSFLKSRIEPVTLRPNIVSGVRVRRGIIEGGKDDGKPLFEGQ